MKSIPKPPLEIVTGTHPTASIIWLHGLGADGYDFAPIVEELRLPFQVRYVLPHAPLLPVTINGGYRMPAWYDITSGDITANQDEAGILSSQHYVETLISQEKSRAIPANRIILAGFSQGGAIALHTGLRHPETLAGIIALSTYLPCDHALEQERSPASIHTPVFMAHGTGDEIVRYKVGNLSRELLVAKGYTVDWHEYRMPHSVCNEEIDDIRNFIVNVLSAFNPA